MAPWPTADVQASYNLSPTLSSIQKESQEPFAIFGSDPGMPQLDQTPVEQKQPAENADPWGAATMAPPAPAVQNPPAAQSLMPAAMAMAPAPAPNAPAPQPPAPAEYIVTTGACNQDPPSPIGDVSVLAAAAAAATTNGAIAVAPTMPIGDAMQPGAECPKPLQPEPQPVRLETPVVPVATPPQTPHVQPALTTSPVNPFDFGAVATSVPAVAPAPTSLPPQVPSLPPQALDLHQQHQEQLKQTISPPTSPVQAGSFAPQAPDYANPFSYAFTPFASPVTSPDNSPGATKNTPGEAMVPSTTMNADPYGVNQNQQDPSAAPNVVSPAMNTQAVVTSAAPSTDPFGVFGCQPSTSASANADLFGSTSPADPFGSSTLAPCPTAEGGAMDDPFGIFGAPTSVPAAPTPAQAPAQTQQTSSSAPTAPAEEDPWAAAGFGSQTASSEQEQHSPNTTFNLTNDSSRTTISIKEEKSVTLDSNGLPSEGEYYEARINVRSLGAMFYTAHNLEETLFLKMPSNVTKALASRPVVAYVAENSAAYNSGIDLGHIIVSVNGQEANDPEACANIIRNAARPMNLRCYVPPEMQLTVSEGKHLVKYDVKDLEAPKTSMEWKRKYVVVGGIVTKPWMMNMFYRKVSGLLYRGSGLLFGNGVWPDTHTSITITS